MKPSTLKLSHWLVLSVAVTLGACATSQNFHAGEQAEQAQQNPPEVTLQY